MVEGAFFHYYVVVSDSRSQSNEHCINGDVDDVVPGCQIVYFQSKPPVLVHFGRPLNGKF
jgi:hypothetical protein